MLNERQTIRLISKTYPDFGASGLIFPFKSIKSCHDNGFGNIVDQSRAHNIILDLIQTNPPKTVIDLGCGNMELLDKIKAEFGSYTYGVDMSADKQPDLVADIFDLDDFPQDFDVALISKARIRENPRGWLKLITIVEKRCSSLVIYSYDKDNELLRPDSYKLLCGITDRNYIADLYIRR
jgi:SAM-dependent methyltransferase